MVKSGHFSHESPPPESVGKRRRADDSDPGSATKKPRSRISFSCSQCHRRKQKCDRQIPCSHCLARKVPELCTPYTPGKGDQDVNSRLARLEQIIEMALPNFWAGSSSPSPLPNSNARSASVEEDCRDDSDPHGGTFQSGKWYGNSASGSIAPGTMLEQLQYALPSAGPLDAHHGPLSNSHSELQVAGLEPSAADNLKSLVQECGVSPHKIAELLQELPPIRTSDVLVDFYFKAINWTRYPISERDFRGAYASISAHGANGLGATEANDIRFLPLLFVVLAIAARLAPEDIAGDARSRRVTSLRYYWSSRRSLLIAVAVQPDSLDIILTRLLSARFLTFDRRITECWSQLGAAVRTAQALGLHRDGAQMGLEPAVVEYRRRIWSYLYHADRSYALVLGRPNSIQDDYTSTQAPSNIEDDSPAAYARPAGPLSAPTPMTFVILRNHLATIIGRIVHHFQKVRTAAHYSEVVILDDELLKFITTLPPHYTLDPDKSLDDSHPFIPVHRFLLITEILFVRTSLHRPYILRRLNTDRYARSRAACYESALKDFDVRQAFRRTISKEIQASLSNAYREFQTAMISGIYLVIEPTGHYADGMHAILDGFLLDHEGLRDIDDTTRREIQLIEFLKVKGSQQSHAMAPITAPIHTDNPAHLLLNLQNSGHSPNQPPFPSLFALPLPSTPHSPQLQFSGNGNGVTASPTFQRLQHTNSGEFVNSPTGSSPSGDEESSAQSLLDHWCNTVNNTPVDGITSWGGPGGADLLGWVGTPATGMADPRLTRLDGNEWNVNYWEALVNQIQRAGP